MNNVVILPLLIPLLTGIILIFFKQNIRLQRVISTIALLSNISVSLWLVYSVHMNGILTLELGNWTPPYGIVFVADMFSVLLVTTSSIASFACVWYAFKTIGEEREKFYFYPFVQFLLTGVYGSFLTGDIFNLFVCFEVMLISSYILIVHGGTKRQLSESIKYVLVNIISSVLFVVAVAYLYGITGTLNMAHLSLRVAEFGQDGALMIVAFLFLIVFSLKAALFLFFWLPGAYSAPPTAIAALFSAMLTKVGIYALFRTFTLIFYHEPGVTHQLLAWMGALTMILGSIGAIAYWNVRKILVYNVIIGVGFIVFGLGIFSASAIEGAIYYLIHDIIVKALLFLAGGFIIAATGTDQLKRVGGLMKRYPVMGWITFAVAISLAGIPPLSGFIGKLLIVQGGLDAGFYTITAVGLLSSLLILYSLIRLFMNAYWREPEESFELKSISMKGLVAPCILLLSLSVFIGLGAELIYPYINQAAETLMDPSIYIQAVLKE